MTSADLQRWQERNRREEGWIALKRLWSAKKTLSNAKTPSAVATAELLIQQIFIQHQDVLPEAVAKWDRLQQYRAQYSQLAVDGELTPQRIDQLWHDLVLRSQ